MSVLLTLKFTKTRVAKYKKRRTCRRHFEAFI